MACYEGVTLKKYIEDGPLPVEKAIDFATQIGKGLARAHEKGIVHRDIKPANIMIVQDGDQETIKILDFGLAKVADVSLTRTGSTIGTVAYMSPEQARGESVDHRTDIWSLGVVFYEMLAGQRPFPGVYEHAVTYALLHEEHKPLTLVQPELSKELEQVLDWALAKDCEERYQTILDFLGDLAGSESPVSSSRLIVKRSANSFFVPSPREYASTTRWRKSTE